jgi:histone H3/H4
VCSVSTCNRKRTGMVFCTVSCWEIHLPVANHREAWALDKVAPSEAQAKAEASGDKPPRAAPTRRIARSAVPEATRGGSDASLEVLIVASRLKDYVRAKSGMATSDRVLEPLSRIVRQVCDRAIRNAERDGRKTVLDRDIPS